MQCPACGNELTEMNVSDLVVDVCRGGCGGLWFDNYELRKVDEAHESLGESLAEIPHDPAVRVDPSVKRPCPKCAGIVMLRRFFGVRKEVEIDECGACGGIWLDGGELARIRGQFASPEERRAAEAAYFEQFHKDLAAMRQENREKIEHVQAFAHLFRFLCPSRYIPGKQDWGAF